LKELLKEITAPDSSPQQGADSCRNFGVPMARRLASDLFREMQTKSRILKKEKKNPLEHIRVIGGGCLTNLI